MSNLPQLEQDLLQAARQRLTGAAGSEPVRSTPPRLGGRRRARRWQLALVVLVCLLATAAIALAAAGVILTGAPVRPTGPLNPAVGEGVPVAGQSRLLPLRVPDPAGGLPWGMRIVHTTRGEVCLQVGRVQRGQLGELGIDGAFHDDGRFHPKPANVLPADATAGASENTSCQLAGETFAGSLTGLDRSATARPDVGTAPREYLRDISYGVLGPHAVSVTYQADGEQRTKPVVPGTGAYLIVQRTRPNEQVGTGGGSQGTDQLHGRRPNPDGAVAVITYRFNGTVCEDSVTGRVDHPCPRPPVTSGPVPFRAPDLHRPLHARLILRGHLIVGAALRFTAPFAVTSARQDYSIAIPAPCHLGTTVTSLNRNVARRSTVRVSLPYPFANACGTTVRVEVLYSNLAGPGRTGAPAPGTVMIGSVTLRVPPGTRPAPPPVGRFHNKR